MTTYPCASRESAYSDEERRNRDVVVAFYENGINRRDLAATVMCLDASFVQHSPYMADGPQGLADFFTELWNTHPHFRIEIKRIFIERDMAAVHLRSLGGPTPNGEAAVDIFRLENGKIVEHWDVVRPVPASAANANSMF